MKDDPILLPGLVSGISKNRCPLCAGIAVRNQQESVSALRKNHCPEWPGISVRFGQEYAILEPETNNAGQPAIFNQYTNTQRGFLDRLPLCKRVSLVVVENITQ